MRFSAFTGIANEKQNEVMRKSFDFLNLRYKKEKMGDTGVMEVLEI